jgi:hypothetical protein
VEEVKALAVGVQIRADPVEATRIGPQIRPRVDAARPVQGVMRDSQQQAQQGELLRGQVACKTTHLVGFSEYLSKRQLFL